MERRMRAAQFETYGPPEVLRIHEVTRPEPETGAVLVEVHACSVNPYDTVVRSGKLRFLPGFRLPLGTGLDFAGRVSATGSQVTDFAVGDRVWGTVPVTGRHKTGAAAEYVSVPAERLARCPATLDDVQAAALAVVGTTALIALSEKVRLKRGERILIRGAAGGVGAAAVQLAHAMGAQVTALASSRDAEFVSGLGADTVFDYTSVRPEDLPAFDVIFDAAGTSLGRFRRRLAVGGRMVTVNFGSLAALFTIGLSTVFGRKRVRTFSADPKRRELEAIAQYVQSGSLQPNVGRVFALDQIVAAHTAVETRSSRGKVVLTF